MLTSAALICAALLGCAAPRPQPEGIQAHTVASADLADFIRLYQTDRGGVSRFYDIPWSETRFDRLQRVYDEWGQELRTVDFAALGQQGKIDAILLRNELTIERARLDRDRKHLGAMNELFPFRQGIQDLARAHWRMDRVDAEAAASAIAAFPDQIKKVRERIDKGKAESKKAKDGEAKPEAKAAEQPAEQSPDAAPATPAPADGPITLSAVDARRAADAVSDIQGSLRDWYRFYDGYQPDFSWWVRKPYEQADAALRDYAKYLRENIAGIKGEDDDPLVGDPIGADGLAADLAAEMIPYTPEELIAIGQEQFAWCEAEMQKAAAEMGFGDDWKAALAKVKEGHVPPGEQDDLVTEQAREAIQFLKDNDLVTIPPLCEETWRLTMISPETQKVLPFAAYGGQNMMVAYPTDAMKHEDKLMSMRGNNRHFSRLVTPHELIPGHHLQGFMAQRQRPYRATFSTPFFVEGWALYWEMTFWDKGWAKGPEDRVGMLFWRMHRCARIIVSLKFHLGQMTPQEMIDFLVDRVGHERFGATSEVRRFIGGDYSPLYQCGYMIGGLQIRALRRELVDTGRMTERQFHDTLLTYGSIPVELIRAGMLDLPLTPETTASWKFAGENPDAAP